MWGSAAQRIESKTVNTVLVLSGELHMPRLIHSVPRYRLHRASGQAVVTIDGRDHYLGVWKSTASKIEYDRLVGEWPSKWPLPCARGGGEETVDG